MSRFVFVTQELDPVVPGGAGAVVANVASSLAEEHEVVVILGTDAEWSGFDPPFRMVRVPVGPPDGSVVWFEERSRRLANALSAVVAEGVPVRLVEFTDFEAPAWWALTHRHELGLTSTPLVIRLHGPGEAISDAVGGTLNPPLDRVGELERLNFTMADAVLVPSAAMGEWAVARYELDEHRMVVAPPPQADVARRVWRPAEAPTFAGLGRLHETKGWHDLIPALSPVLDAYPAARLRLIGSDGWSTTFDRPMSEVLHEAIPPEHRSRIEILGRLPRDEALDLLASAWAVVVPSRFETFCLAAHEARRAGFPVIAPDLPAFADHREGFGLLVYDGTMAGLSSTLMRVAADRSILDRLAAEPVPPVGDALSPYLGAMPSARHPNSQAGLATKAVEWFGTTAPVERRRSAPLARGLLRLVPAPLARLASRLLPGRWKSRFRKTASWWEEEARRDAVARRRRIDELIARGAFPKIEQPRVSVVIPCFEQGEWVEGAVLSVFEQSDDSWEAVLVDDGSSDPATIAELDRLATHPRVRLVRQENKGLAAARNAGISIALGEFVVPLDADDELHATFIEEMLPRLRAEPSAGYAHCWAELFGDIEAIWATRPFNPYWQLLSNGVVGCVLLRRSAWAAVGGYDESMRSGHEDWELWNRLAAAGWGQVRVCRPLFRYRKRGGSMSVESEAAFEAGLSALVERHPEHYQGDHLRAVKADWYPFVSLLVDPNRALVPPEDTEVLEATDLAAAVARSNGKFVADLRSGGDPATAIQLAERLEATPRVANAADTEGGVTVWRRWALIDRGTELTLSPAEDAPGSDLGFGAFPDLDWIIDPDAIPSGFRVMRQRPEESGRIPEWVEE